ARLLATSLSSPSSGFRYFLPADAGRRGRRARESVGRGDFFLKREYQAGPGTPSGINAAKDIHIVQITVFKRSGEPPDFIDPKDTVRACRPIVVKRAVQREDVAVIRQHRESADGQLDSALDRHIGRVIEVVIHPAKPG